FYAGLGVDTIMYAWYLPEPLVGRVRVASRQVPGVHDGVDAETGIEDVGGRQGAAHAGEARGTTEELVERLGGGDGDRIRAVERVGPGTAGEALELDSGARRGAPFDVALDHLQNRVGILVGAAPAAHLDLRVARRHGLRADALLAAPDSGEIGGGSGPHAFDRRPPLLAPEFVETEICRERGLVEGCLGDFRSFL